MGGAESTQAQQDDFQRDLSKNYQFLKEITDKRFGEVQIYKHKSDDNFIARRGQLCNSSEDYNDFVKKASSRRNLNHKNIINVLNFQDANEDTYCGDFNKLTIYFEYFFLDLEKELSRRRQNAEYLKESELWYLLDSLISAGYYLQQRNIYHGDYQPANILLTNEGQVKIGDFGLLHTDQSSYFKMLSGLDKALLSPAQLEALRNKETVPVHDFWKSDIYSLGMTILEVATLAPSYHCYDFNRLEIIPSKVEELLNHATKQYGRFLVSILRDMLNVNETIRPNFVDLDAVLKPYQQRIQNFQPINGPLVQSVVRTVQQPPVQSLPTYQPVQSRVVQPAQSVQASQIIRSQAPQQVRYVQGGVPLGASVVRGPVQQYY